MRKESLLEKFKRYYRRTVIKIAFCSSIAIIIAVVLFLTGFRIVYPSDLEVDWEAFSGFWQMIGAISSICLTGIIIYQTQQNHNRETKIQLAKIRRDIYDNLEAAFSYAEQMRHWYYNLPELKSLSQAVLNSIELDYKEEAEPLTLKIIELKMMMNNPDMDKTTKEQMNRVITHIYGQRHFFSRRRTAENLRKIRDCEYWFSDDIKPIILDFCNKYEKVVLGLMDQKINDRFDARECNEMDELMSVCDIIQSHNILQRMEKECQIF